MKHTPLHHLHRLGPVLTAGRTVLLEGGLYLENAHVRVPLEADPLPEHVLIRVEANWDGKRLQAKSVERVGPSPATSPHHHGRAEAVRARHDMSERIRAFFARHDFLEVRTPCWIQEPGTDVHLEPFVAPFLLEGLSLPGYLQTSPELSMKRLLVEGFERIMQLTSAWRNGEVTDWHVPEFTILEWYRAWEPVEAIMDDVEALTRMSLRGVAKRRSMSSMITDQDYDLEAPFARVPMAELIEQACGFDIRDALTHERLREACARHGLLGITAPPPSHDQGGFVEGRREHTLEIFGPSRSKDDVEWDELFFELQVTYLDPLLARIGPIFVTEWPAPLAVLAKRDADDPRVARRFELYIGGVELANGFEELTDPVEQRERFQDDIRRRQDLGHDALPMPSAFLTALERGMPPAAGVAMGLDRLLMLATGARTIQDVLPYSMQRDPERGGFRWG